MSGTGQDSLQEVILRIERLTSCYDAGNASIVDIKIAEDYLSRLLQLEEIPEKFFSETYHEALSLGNGTSSRRSSQEITFILCQLCGTEGQARCHICNEYLCKKCANNHEKETQRELSKHVVEYFPPPIGSPRSNSSHNSGTSSIGSNGSPPSYSQILRGSSNLLGLSEKNGGSVQNSELQSNSTLNFSQTSSLFINTQESFCFLHSMPARYVCTGKKCKKFVCNICICSNHRGHIYMMIGKFAACCVERIRNVSHYSNIGLQRIKGKIDEVLRSQYRFERDCLELKQNIDRMQQQLGILTDTVVDALQEKIQLYKREKLNILQEQMVQLKAVLASYSDVSSNLHHLTLHSHSIDGIFVATNYFNYESRLEQLGENYRWVEPKQWYIFYFPPVAKLDSVGKIFCGELNDANREQVRLLQQEFVNYLALQQQSFIDIKGQVNFLNRYGSKLLSNDININSWPDSPILSLLKTPTSLMLDLTSSIHSALSSPLLSIPSSSGLNLPSTSLALRSEAPLIRSSTPNQAINLALPSKKSSNVEIKKQEENNSLPKLLYSFGSEGKALGEICRPWGICTDLDGNVVISDRRNHRIQVFTPEGVLLYAFGQEGDGDGEFQLPAGVCVDVANRIIVVDKDNHRVQIFSAFGRFILKFGKVGKERGQFQYPWGITVNSKQQILVTDSRNHRVQQFDADGRFIKSISFEFGITKPSPRGVSFTADGLLLVSDFDNHCLYLIDTDLRTILRTIGGEGHTLHHFNRPSGIALNEDGLVAVADSKNQRILIFNRRFKVILHIKICSLIAPKNPGCRDRVSDITFISNDRLAFISELSPDEKQLQDQTKTFIHIIKLPYLQNY